MHGAQRTMDATDTHRGDILVVDDSPVNVELLLAMLGKKGYRVRAAGSGALALEAARAEQPELILLDIAMPQMDGFEVCRRLKQDPALEAIPVIFLSALKETCDKVKAFSLGGADYVTKPFRPEEIMARIDTHLSLRRLRAALERSNRELESSCARLQETERMRQALVQMIVHDLKSPLTGIRLNSEFVSEQGGLEGDLSEAVQSIHVLSSAMSRMVLDVLDVAHSEQVALQPRPTSLDPRELVQAVARDMRMAVKHADKTLATSVAEDVPRVVSADGELLRRVLGNLLDNALKYAPPGDKVRLEAARDGRGYSFRVRRRAGNSRAEPRLGLLALCSARAGPAVSRPHEQRPRPGVLQARRRGPWRPHLGRGQSTVGDPVRRAAPAGPARGRCSSHHRQTCDGLIGMRCLVRGGLGEPR